MINLSAVTQAVGSPELRPTAAAALPCDHSRVRCIRRTTIWLSEENSARFVT